MDRKKVLFIMNPKSGTMQASKMLSDIIQLFSNAGWMTSVLMTAARGDATQFASQYAKDFDQIVVSGGDGTLNEAVDGIIASGADIPVGYIPAGSTNDFAHSLGLPTTIVEAARRAVEGKPKELDLGNFNGRHFSYVASFGAFSSTSYSVPQNLKNILGHNAYILSGIKDLVNIKPIHAKVISDPGTENEVVKEGEYLFGAVCNTTSVGGIVQLKKEFVDMNDGKMELLLIRMPNDILELGDIVGNMLIGELDAKEIDFFSAKKFSIDIEAGTHWTLDGEYEEGAEHIEIETIDSAIKIIC